MKIFLIILALLLDGVLSVKIPTSSIFLPLLTLTTIFLIYPFYRKKTKKYITVLMITGFIYDLMYTNLLFFHAIVFSLLGLLIKFIYKNYHQNTLQCILYLIIIIAIYELLIATILFLFRTTTITITKVLYQISKSLLLNIIYVIIFRSLLNYKS